MKLFGLLSCFLVFSLSLLATPLPDVQTLDSGPDIELVDVLFMPEFDEVVTLNSAMPEFYGYLMGSKTLLLDASTYGKLPENRVKVFDSLNLYGYTYCYIRLLPLPEDSDEKPGRCSLTV